MKVFVILFCMSAVLFLLFCKPAVKNKMGAGMEKESRGPRTTICKVSDIGKAKKGDDLAYSTEPAYDLPLCISFYIGDYESDLQQVTLESGKKGCIMTY